MAMGHDFYNLFSPYSLLLLVVDNYCIYLQAGANQNISILIHLSIDQRPYA
jgi:hypothetical protein